MDLMVLREQSGDMFFSAYCQEVGKEVLLGPDNFVDLVTGPDGFELHYRCHCGRSGVVHPQASAPAGRAA
ncbi:MAG TPA: hypothetical protein VG435_10465 [Acidimicrobiales bacterium]|nr:hypothetical protein [Acidimicrobiales bacterium]